MSQHSCSASSRCLIFYAIISFLILQVVARHRFNHNNLLREQEKRGKPFEDVEKEFPKLVKLLFLKPPVLDHHKNAQQLIPATPPSDDDIKINTSCGRINCEDVPNYPAELIKELLEEQTGIFPETIPALQHSEDYEDTDKFVNSDEADESEETEIARAVTPFGRSFNPSSWRYPNEYNPGDVPRTAYDCKILGDMFTAEQEEKFSEESRRNNQDICLFKLKETKPKETIDTEKQPYNLVNDYDSIIIKGYECTAGLDCYDRTMSMGYKYRCETFWDYRDLCALNTERTAIIQRKVAIADGCNCTSVKMDG